VVRVVRVPGLAVQVALLEQLERQGRLERLGLVVQVALLEQLERQGRLERLGLVVQVALLG
jgi:hypothetical protein